MLREMDGYSSKINLAILASGSGSNLGALISAVESQAINNADISLVISNKETAYALTRAQKANIPAICLKRNLFNSDEEYDREVIKNLKEYNIDVVILAGYLRIITKPFLKAFEGRILNIHPSLLPDFGGKGMYGAKVHEAVINAKKAKSGCSVHIVTEEIDGGPILAQACVPVSPNDTPESLAKKVLKEEHKLYPTAVNDFIAKSYYSHLTT